MKKRKCIALLIAQPERAYQSQLISGILRAAHEHDVNVAAFCTMMQQGGMEDFQIGEMEIFTALNFARMDGVLYVPDSIHLHGSEELMQRVRTTCRCPVLTIDLDVEGYPSVFCDDGSAISDVITHLIDVHDCHDIAFMTGIRGHEHSTNRLAAFRQVMQERGLAVPEDRIYYGDFWYDEGENFVKVLMQSPHGMPEAIACASSRMAYSVCEALQKNGFRVPGDVRVTGLNEGMARFEYITSCDRNAADAGHRALEMLCEMMDGVPYAPKRYVCPCEASVNAAVTCGCVNHYVPHHVNAVFIDEDSGYFSVYNDMTSTMVGASDFNDWLWLLKWYTLYIPYMREIYVCMCENWERTTPDGIDPEVLTSYTPRMNLALAMQGENCSVDLNRWFSLEEMLPRLWEETEEPQTFFFNSLHFKKQCFGYVVMSVGAEQNGYDCIYSFWLQNICNTLESQLRLYNIRHLYACMERNAIIDLMTGLHNRNGFNLMTPQLTEDARMENRQMLVMMADLNGLKYINDTFGHDNGDETIRLSARTFGGSHVCGADTEHHFRIGGDEFVKVAIGKFTTAEINACICSVREALTCYNQRANKPYPVYLSIGYCLKNANEITTFDEALVEADLAMYRDKLELKRQTGFDPKRTG